MVSTSAASLLALTRKAPLDDLIFWTHLRFICYKVADINILSFVGRAVSVALTHFCHSNHENSHRQNVNSFTLYKPSMGEQTVAHLTNFYWTFIKLLNISDPIQNVNSGIISILFLTIVLEHNTTNGTFIEWKNGYMNARQNKIYRLEKVQQTLWGPSWPGYLHSQGDYGSVWDKRKLPSRSFIFGNLANWPSQNRKAPSWPTFAKEAAWSLELIIQYCTLEICWE